MGSNEPKISEDYDKLCDEHGKLLEDLKMACAKLNKEYKILLKHATSSFRKINEEMLKISEKTGETVNDLPNIYKIYVNRDEKAILKYFEDEKCDLAHPSGRRTAQLDLMIEIHSFLRDWFEKKNVKSIFEKGGLIYEYETHFSEISEINAETEKHFWDIHKRMDKLEEKMDAMDAES